MVKKSDNTIAIWATDTNGNKQSALPKIARKVVATTQVSAEVLSDNLKAFVKNFQDVIDPGNDIGGFVIDEVELSLVVNAKGGIELLGKLEVGAQASMKIKLKRRTEN